MSATHATGVIELYELQSILKERSHRKAVQRAVEVIAGIVPSCSVTLMTIGLRGQLHIEAWMNVATSIVRSAERSFNREGLPRNLADLVRTKKPAIIEDLSSYADWREPARKQPTNRDCKQRSITFSNVSVVSWDMNMLSSSCTTRTARRSCLWPIVGVSSRALAWK